MYIIAHSSTTPVTWMPERTHCAFFSYWLLMAWMSVLPHASDNEYPKLVHLRYRRDPCFDLSTSLCPLTSQRTTTPPHHTQRRPVNEFPTAALSHVMSHNQCEPWECEAMLAEMTQRLPLRHKCGCDKPSKRHDSEGYKAQLKQNTEENGS
jgi:hypothetical protein